MAGDNGGAKNENDEDEDLNKTIGLNWIREGHDIGNRKSK